MLVRYQKREYLNRLQRWCMKRWLIAADEAQGLAARQAAQALYSKACNRADRWFAVCDRVARLVRVPSGG